MQEVRNQTWKEAHREGVVAKKIENQTAKLPSDLFLWSGLAIGATAFALHCANQKHSALLLGQWIAPFLIFGLYDKIVKQGGHDALSAEKKRIISNR